MSFARQFAEPSGFPGRVAGWMMARFNRPLADWALDLLAPPPEAVLLEVGCGPGRGLTRAAVRVPRGRVLAIEPSAVMRAQAAAHVARLGLSARIDLHAARVDAVPLAAGSVDGAFAVNSSPFWTDLEAGLRELGRVLRAGSPLALVVQPRWLCEDGEVTALRDQHARALARTGYAHVVQGFRGLARGGAFSLVARAPV